MAQTPIKFSEIAERALRTVRVIGRGVVMQPYHLQVAFEAANDMFDAWAAQRLTIFQNLRKVFPIVAGQGSTTNPYLVGVGGDLDLQRPTWIDDANLQDTSNDPPFEYGLDILTPAEWAGVPMKDLPNSLAQALFYNGRFDTSGVDMGLGELFLTPVPNGELPLELVLYLPIPMTGFDDVDTTEYLFPFGYREAIRYQLAKRLASEFGKELDPATQQLVTDTWAVIQRPNTPMPPMRSDYGLPGTGAAAGLYNWRTGTNTPRGGY